jgi:NAD-dependent deacetylase
MSDSKYEKIAEMIVKSKLTVVLTGAGLSTESGIPDFRSKGTGLWEKIDPMEALSTNVLYGNPEKFYRTGFKILTGMKGAKPNKAHLILAKMEKEGLISAVITQNIDNLHYDAGSKNIMEVHGNIRTGHCVKCRKTYGFNVIEEKVANGEIPPLCTCGGMMRPDVVFFGDSLPDCFNKAWEISSRCDLMIVIGSSLQVGPVNYLPSLAKKLVIINKGDTMYDRRADVLCNESASSALDNIYAKIQEIKASGR